jgi:tRNA U34 5-methylaminomethyl-2-thiouridine-forming methyltransferase MnmC
MSDVQLITTSDGSHSLLNTQLNETYHSVHGAIRESVYVFIKKGLDFLIERNNPHELHILEIGFGTGLNALLTLQKQLSNSVKIYYTTIETYPLPEEVWSHLNYADALEATEYFNHLHRAEWEKWQEIIPGFHLLKIKTTLQQIDLTASKYDLIYFDAFAPSKQPEMWEYPVLEKVVQRMNPGGVFVTYCAKGQLKRDLKSLGLEVETLEGPPGKKEMVRGTTHRDLK